MKRRNSILLLEMIIALVIMAGVMAMLFSGFYSAIQCKNKVKKERERILTLQRLKLRFAVLFKDVINVKQVSENEYHIRYKGGIDPNPNFRLEIETFLKLNNKILSLTSYPEKGDPRLEILSENATSICFEFFDEIKGKFTQEYPEQKPRMMKVILSGTELPLFL